MVAGNLVRELTKPVKCPMRSLIYTTRVRISYERSIEKWIQHPIQRVVNQPIPHSCLVNIPGFGVGDVKRLID